MGSGASRQTGSSGKEYARRLRALKLPAPGHSACFFVDVAMREEFGRACMNHANRQGLITTAKDMLQSEIPLSLFSFISLPQTLACKCSTIIPKISAFVILRPRR